MDIKRGNQNLYFYRERFSKSDLGGVGLVVIIVIILSITTLMLSARISRRSGLFLNPYSVMTYIWIIMVFFATSASEMVHFRSMGISGVLFIYGFLLIVGLVIYMLVNVFNCRISTINFNLTGVNTKRLSLIAYLLFFYSVLCNMVYWYDINNLIGINQVLINPWILKHYILTGLIDEQSIRYLGRNLSIIGVVILTAYYCTKKKIFLPMLGLYIIFAFLNIRRDPVLVKIIPLLAVYFLANSKDIKRLIKVLVPVALSFLVFFFVTMLSLNIDEVEIGRVLFSYTAGTFSSLQAMIDYGYPTSNSLPLGHTFYWFYALIKFIDTDYTPPAIILESINEDTTNVYSALSYIVIDAHGDMFLMLLLLLLYGIYVGIIMGSAIVLIGKRVNFISLIYYSAVMSCTVRSFMNPTFSHTDIMFAVFYGIILHIIMSKVKYS